MAAPQPSEALTRFTEQFRTLISESGDTASALHTARTRAMERLGTTGFPTLRDEEWRFTNLQPLLGTAFTTAATDAAHDAAVRSALASLPFLADGVAVLVFVNGAFAPAHSRVPAEGALTVATIASMRTAHAEEILAVHGAMEEGVYNAFADLNTAFLTDGAFVRIAENTVAEAPVHLVYITVPGATPMFTAPRTLVRAARGSEVTVTETFLTAGEGVHFTTAVMQCLVAENASVKHVRTQIEGAGAYHTSTVTALLARSSRFTTTGSTLGAALARNDVYVRFAGEGGEAVLDGISLVRGVQVADNHTFIDHASPNCASHELYKGVFDGEARGVFAGRIIVRKDAQKTDARQANNNLLLSDTASIDTKPQLEILADDVKCTHGATIGRLDEDALFYLRARGIGSVQARAILTVAFAGEVVGRVADPAVRAWLDALMHERLEETSA